MPKGMPLSLMCCLARLMRRVMGTYDTVGVNSFQALLAPFLIDNPTLEQRVPESDLAGEMLAGTSRLGLVGLAMQPTDLRNRQACRVRWWRSRTTGYPHRHSGRRGRQGDLYRLGATPVGIAQADRSGGSTEPNSISAGSTGTSMTCRRSVTALVSACRRPEVGEHGEYAPVVVG
jgi:hypothetical protein